MRWLSLIVLMSSLAFAQPLNGCPNPNMTCASGKFTSLNITTLNALSVDAGTGLFNGSVRSPIGKFDTLDAGVLNVQGALGTQGSWSLAQGCVTGTTSATTFGCPATFGTNTSLTLGSNVALFLGTGTSRIVGSAGTAQSVVAPTVTACVGGTAATMTANNGTGGFQFDVGTSCASESTAVVTMPAAATGWVCSCSVTTADRAIIQRVMPTASTTTVTLQHITISTGANTDFTDSADVACVCQGI